MRTVLHVITGLGNGGAEAVLYRLCTHDRDNRHHVVSLTDQGTYGPLLIKAGIPVTCLGMPRGRVTLAGLREMRHTIRRIRPDVVQTWMYHANLLGGIVARLSGVRNVQWGIRQSELAPENFPRSTILVNRISAPLSRWIPRQIICCADKARDVHVRLGYDPERTLVIPNGYDLSAFQPDRESGKALRAAWGLNSSEPVIGFVARFHPMKDHANLFHALAILRESGVRPACLLVGTGMSYENAELTRMVVGFGLADQVRLLGPRSDIPAVMNALDLHVMSSSGEGFPNVLAEAMACGIPCVSTDVGDAAKILYDTGRIVPPRNSAALATAIAEMLAELGSPRWSRVQEAARQHVAHHFSMPRMLENYRRAWFGGQAPAREVKPNVRGR